jgi:hypothetical protein
MNIKDILKLDFSEDIKNVIDLEDRSQIEIQKEIESYIVTDNIAEHFQKFISLYTSNIKETGVWISGFYGSGKSYFGKMLGYLLENPTINGTPARVRFKPRLSGVKGEELLKNEIGKLDAYDTLLVMLDVAKQSGKHGLHYMLFRNFLRSLGFLDNLYGVFEFELFIDDELDEFKDRIKENEGKEWSEVKKSSMKVPAAVSRALIDWKFKEEEYQKTREYLEDEIESFSPSKLKERLERYLEKYPDTKIVFIFDEASEAIAQGKIKLTDLEGVSEALSGIAQKVWTIAIAQEKLDDVINNSNVSKQNLVKVTDRFKTKIPLESTEVDKIIRSRLLQKKEEALPELENYYNQNVGLVSENTNLDSTFPTKTEDIDEFTTYYPFHRYQFDLLQNFLFQSKTLTSTQIAARGMIITTFDVLRKQLKDTDIYNFATSYHLTTEAQPNPDAALVNKYDNASKILHNEGSEIVGKKLLKAIHFIDESERVKATASNITKMYLSDISHYHEVKPHVDEALNLLKDQKILIENNHVYKITSDLETKLLKELNEFPVELHRKKREVIQLLKKNTHLKSVQTVRDNNDNYSFRIVSDQGDDIFGTSSSDMSIVVHNIYNINEKKLEDFVEKQKLKSQDDKRTIYLVPDISLFDEIDRLIQEVQQHEYIADKYKTDNDDRVRQIAREFELIKDQKQKELNRQLEKAYLNGHLIYLFSDSILDKDQFSATVAKTQKKLIGNIFTKRLEHQLSDETASKVLKENHKDRLHRFFSGDDFKFFDQNGNFIGESLKITEEVTRLIDTKFTDGDHIERELNADPTGYSFGTVSTTLAVLMKAGKLVVKYGGNEYFDPNDKEVLKVFSNSREFKKASFKAISETLDTATKKNIVETLLDVKYNEQIRNQDDPRVDYNLNDFQLVQATVQTALSFAQQIQGMEQSTADFQQRFSNIANMKSELGSFTGQVTEHNYIDKAKHFVEQSDRIRDIRKSIQKTQRFIKNNLNKANEMNRFVDDLKIELNKAEVDISLFEEDIQSFKEIYNNDLAERFGELQQKAISIKDQYYELMKEANSEMNVAYQRVVNKADEVLNELNEFAEYNESNIVKAEKIREKASKKIIDSVNLEFSISDTNSHYSLSEIQNETRLSPNVISELEMLLIQMVTEPAPEPGGGKPDPKPEPAKKITLSVPGTEMTANEYRQLLFGQMKHLRGLPDDAKVEITIEEIA